MNLDVVQDSIMTNVFDRRSVTICMNRRTWRELCATVSLTCSPDPLVEQFVGDDGHLYTGLAQTAHVSPNILMGVPVVINEILDDETIRIVSRSS